LAEAPATAEAESFEYALHLFLGCACALATDDAEGQPFSYFIAHEYLWEAGLAVPWLTDAPASYLNDFEKAAIRRFVAQVPPARTALEDAQGRPADAADTPLPHGWPDERPIPDLPAWNTLASSAATLMDQLSEAIGRNGAYFAQLG